VSVQSVLRRLHERNEFLIGSHYPLRETLIQQTGVNERSRRMFLSDFDRAVIAN